MKIHTFQIEVVWLFLAMMYCYIKDTESNVCAYNTKHENKVLIEQGYNIQIRPPPSGGEKIP